MKTLTLVTTLILFGGSFACASTPPLHDEANPAAVFCAQIGGVDTLCKDSDGNENGMCAFGRGVIPEWTLFHELHAAPTIAVKTFLANIQYHPQPGNHGPSMPNPASYNCTMSGGTTVIYSTADGQFGVCRFSDNSGMEEWTLFRGPNDAVNSVLTGLLKHTK